MHFDDAGSSLGSGITGVASTSADSTAPNRNVYSNQVFNLQDVSVLESKT